MIKLKNNWRIKKEGGRKEKKRKKERRRKTIEGEKERKDKRRKGEKHNFCSLSNLLRRIYKELETI